MTVLGVKVKKEKEKGFLLRGGEPRALHAPWGSGRLGGSAMRLRREHGGARIAALYMAAAVAFN